MHCHGSTCTTSVVRKYRRQLFGSPNVSQSMFPLKACK